MFWMIVMKSFSKKYIFVSFFSIIMKKKTVFNIQDLFTQQQKVNDLHRKKKIEFYLSLK